jgi:predicted ArsR family transcriptional regulator
MSLLLEEPQTAVEIAQKLEIFESAVRQHLQMLENAGLVTATFEQRGLGRPKKIFALSPSGAELFTRKYDVLLDLVIRKIGETYGPPALRSILLSTARGLSITLGVVSDDLLYRERLRKVTDALDDLGFAAKLEEKDGKSSIISKNCILLRTAEANHDLLCHKFHSELIRAALKRGRVELHECMVDGAPFCTHIVIKSDRDD